MVGWSSHRKMGFPVASHPPAFAVPRNVAPCVVSDLLMGGGGRKEEGKGKEKEREEEQARLPRLGQG